MIFDVTMALMGSFKKSPKLSQVDFFKLPCVHDQESGESRKYCDGKDDVYAHLRTPI